MDSTSKAARDEFDRMSDGPPAIAADPSFRDIIGGYIALADADRIKTASAERTHENWMKSKQKIEELRQMLAQPEQPQ